MRKARERERERAGSIFRVDIRGFVCITNQAINEVNRFFEQIIERMLFSEFARVDIDIQIVYKGEGETGYRRRNARREHAVREIIGQKLITNSVSVRT